MTHSQPTIWALALPEAGFRSQVIGLAEALNVPFVLKNVNLKKPWSLMPVRFCPLALMGLDAESDALTPPWPDLVIGCGRRTIPLALAIKRASHGKTRAVHIQDPKSATPLFDLVIPMKHDDAQGPNVMSVDTALHRITDKKLNEAAKSWTSSFSSLQRPLVGVILGGSNRAFRLTKEVAERLIEILQDLHQTTGAHFYIAASRRTDADALQAFTHFSESASHIRFWKGEGENPYLGILALSDALIVTEDSVSMISEALATGKPVAIFPLAGMSKRHGLFIDNLMTRGAITRFDGTLPQAASIHLPNATKIAANEVRKLITITEP